MNSSLKINFKYFTFISIFLLDILLVFFENKFIQYSQIIFIIILLFNNIFLGIKFKRSYFFLFFFIYIFYILYSFLQNNDLKYLGMDIITFAPIFIIFSINSIEEANFLVIKITKLFSQILPICILLSFYILISAKIKPGNDDLRLDVSSNIQDIFNWNGVTLILLPVLIIAPFISVLKTKYISIWFIGIFFYLFYGLFVLTREYIFVSVSSLLIGIYSINYKDRFKYISYLLLLLVLVIFFVIYTYGLDNFTSNIFSNFLRFSDNQDITSGRDLESKSLFDSYNGLEWIFGRGFGGFNSSYTLGAIDSVAFVHFGLVYLILKGGLLYFIFITAIYFFTLFKAYKYNKKVFFTIMVYLLQDIFMHSQWVYYSRTTFIWLLFAIVFQYDNSSKKLIF